MKKLLCALSLLALCSSLAAATVPDAGFCTVSPIYQPAGNTDPALEALLVCPANYAGSYYTITVHNSSDNAVPNAIVQFIFDSEIMVCGTPIPIHEVTADLDGVAHLYLRGGGCLTNKTDAIRVLANGVQIRMFKGVRSPDNADHILSFPSLSMTASDLTMFGLEFKGVVAAGCHDYTMDSSCSAGDLAIFGAAFKGGFTCTP
jgi:hypothetical protein